MAPQCGTNGVNGSRSQVDIWMGEEHPFEACEEQATLRAARLGRLTVLVLGRAHGTVP